MGILALKQGYIVKSVLLLSFLGIISLGLIGGCSDGGGGNDPQALTENDFAEDSSLRAELDEGVVVTFLESPGSEEENDTGTPGVDVIPVIYEETTEQTFCWEDDNAQAMHFMELRDLEGNRILTVDGTGDCVTQVIEAGEYVVSIYHDESAGEALPIFLITDTEDTEQSEQAGKTQGFIDRFHAAASNILETIHKTVTKHALAQTREENRQTILSTNSCPGCNLNGANLNDANLSGARLTQARLFNARLNRADLSNARLIRADLTGALMTRAILNRARLNAADLSFATLTNADLTRANFSGATWCDGMCICAADSFGDGRCLKCAPVNICTIH